MNTDGSLLVFCIVQCLFVPTFRKNISKSPLKLIHHEDGCDMLPWNVKTSVPRCKNPKRDYQWNNIHLKNLRTNMHFQFLPQRTLSGSPMTKRSQSELFTEMIAYYYKYHRNTNTLCGENTQLISVTACGIVQVSKDTGLHQSICMCPLFALPTLSTRRPDQLATYRHQHALKNHVRSRVTGSSQSAFDWPLMSTINPFAVSEQPALNDS